MRTASVLLALPVVLGLSAPAPAAEAGGASSYKGIWISTPFPAFSTTAGETVTLDLSVHNAGLPPQRVQLDIERMPGVEVPAAEGDVDRLREVGERVVGVHEQDAAVRCSTTPFQQHLDRHPVRHRTRPPPGTLLRLRTAVSAYWSSSASRSMSSPSRQVPSGARS